MIALCDQIFTLSDRLKNIVNDEYLAQITESSLKVLQKRHVQWTVARNLQQSQSTMSPRPRTPPPARVTRPAVPSVPRDAGGRFRARSAEELDAYSFAAARDALEQLDPSVSPVSGGNLSGVNREFLLSVAGLYPVPVLGGWGDSLVFRSPSLRTKAITELQQMDAVFDSTLFDIIERNSLYVQKAHLVTLKWREVVPIGRATALWALLSLSETPPADTLRAGWLIKAIAAAQDLKPAGLVPYIDTLHLVVENFDQVRGEFPVEFLHQLLSTLVLYTLERSGDPGLQSLVQNWRRQYGARVDVDMFAKATLGKALISLRPAHAKFSDISQILLDLQILVGSPSVGLSGVPEAQPLHSFAALTPHSPRVSRKARIDDRPGALGARHLGDEHPGGGHRADRRDFKSGPRFLGSVPQGPHDAIRCWYCAGMLKTARQFFVDTVDKHAPVSPVRTAEHPFLQCRYFKGEMLVIAKTVFKGSGAPPRVFPALVDFGALSSSESDSHDECSIGEKSLN